MLVALGVKQMLVRLMTIMMMDKEQAGLVSDQFLLCQTLKARKTHHPALGEVILAIHGVPHLDKMKLTVVRGRERDGERK